MLSTLYACFVSAFVALATLGHVLLLIAVYPNLFGTPANDETEADVIAARDTLSPHDPRMAT
jgi:hypothetical protein